MRLESLPIVIGAFVVLIGLGFILDATLPDRPWSWRERRRRTRTERDRFGEVLVGLGTLALAAALIGRDLWNYGTVAVLVGAVLLVGGAWRNAAYLREFFVFRGAARRGEKRQHPRAARADAPVEVSRPSRPSRPPRPAATIEQERPIRAAPLADLRGQKPDGDPPGGEERMRIR